MKVQDQHQIKPETQSCQTSVMVSADYKGYRIDQDRTGFAPKNMVFHFWINDGENVAGFGESVEDCKEQIDEIIYLNE